MVGGLWPLLIGKLRGIENSAGNQKKHIKHKHIYTLGLHVFIKIIRGFRSLTIVRREEEAA